MGRPAGFTWTRRQRAAIAAATKAAMARPDVRAKLQRKTARPPTTATTPTTPGGCPHCPHCQAQTIPAPSPVDGWYHLGYARAEGPVILDRHVAPTRDQAALEAHATSVRPPRGTQWVIWGPRPAPSHASSVERTVPDVRFLRLSPTPVLKGRTRATV